MSNLYIENSPGGTAVREGKGLRTKLPVILSGTAATLAVGGTTTQTGVATFNAAPVFAAGLTASGAVSNDFSGGSGTFKTSTGAVTLGGNTTVSGAGTFTSGTGAVTLSGAVTQKANVVSGSGATVTLTAAQSGSTVLFDRAAGIVFTLPAPAVGMYFNFYTSVTVTSNNYKVITDAGTTLLVGSLVNIKTDLTTLFSIADNSSHIAVLMNGTTTGGLVGTWLSFACVTATRWSVSGSNLASGTIATPLSAS